MSDEENKEESAESPNIDSLDLASVRHYVDMVNVQHEKDMSQINGRIGDLSASIEKMHQDLKDHIKSIDNKTNTKFDTIDQALRGNGRIGIFEQIRGIKVKQRFIILFICLLFGAKIWGLTFNDWFKENFFPQDTPVEDVIDDQKDIADGNRLVVKDSE